MRAAGVEDRVRGFAQPLGYACATTETVVELDLLSADISPVQPPEGYTVATYLNGVPEHLRAQVGVLKGDRERGGTPTAPCSGNPTRSRRRSTEPRSGFGSSRVARRSSPSRSRPAPAMPRSDRQYPPARHRAEPRPMPEVHPVHRAVCCPLDVSEVCQLGDHHANEPRDCGSSAAPGHAAGRGQELDKPWTSTCLASAKTRWRASSSAVDQSEPH